jgi:hypothetical protein
MHYKDTFALCIMFHLHIGDATQASNLHLRQVMHNDHPSM